MREALARRELVRCLVWQGERSRTLRQYCELADLLAAEAQGHPGVCQSFASARGEWHQEVGMQVGYLRHG